MAKLTAGIAARAYLIVLLVLTFLFGSPVQLGVAAALLAIQLYSVYKLPKASLNMVLTVASLVLAPIALEALVGVYAFLLVIPALFLFDEALKSMATDQVLSFHKVGRRASDALKGLCGSLLLVLGVSVIVWNITLALTATVMLGFVGLLVASTLRGVSKASLVETKSWSRIVAGDTETKKCTITNYAKNGLLGTIDVTDSWVGVDQPILRMSPKGNVEVTMWFTPPLAGPSKIQLKTTYVDGRGLIETGQLLEPLSLHIIPRAKYAQWLANKFLEQTAHGEGMTGAQSSNNMISKQGLDYHSNRPYQTGDPLKNIDWRHSYMLDELIVKQFSGSQGNVGVIVADLTASDAEETDVLAYNLVMSTLTLAREGLPSALAAYSQQEVIAVTQTMDSREILKKAIELTEKICIEEYKDKVLQPVELQRVKRSIDQLEKSPKLPAQKIAQVLITETEAHREGAKLHPALIALSQVVKGLQGPAVLTVICSPSVDSDALSFELERLKERGYRTVIVSEKHR
jgi:Uncharacterized conserved protein (some members contain a von Willebrand factor type A (vWA) domain)